MSSFGFGVDLEATWIVARKVNGDFAGSKYF